MFNSNQPKLSYFESEVLPFDKTSLTLPGGKKEPYFYSLGAESTVPFVILEGGGATQKIFSWGEMIQVNPGQLVTVKSASPMLGDIVINGGHDYAAKPDRVSVPVPMLFTGAGFDDPGAVVTPEFPADTRLCRRAYLALQIATNQDSQPVGIIGTNFKHSFTATPALDTNNYLDNVIISPFTLGAIIPLGFSSQFMPLAPMALADKVEFTMTRPANPGNLSGLAMYILEY